MEEDKTDQSKSNPSSTLGVNYDKYLAEKEKKLRQTYEASKSWKNLWGILDSRYHDTIKLIEAVRSGIQQSGLDLEDIKLYHAKNREHPNEKMAATVKKGETIEIGLAPIEDIVQGVRKNISSEICKLIGHELQHSRSLRAAIKLKQYGIIEQKLGATFKKQGIDIYRDLQEAMVGNREATGRITRFSNKYRIDVNKLLECVKNGEEEKVVKIITDAMESLKQRSKSREKSFFGKGLRAVARFINFFLPKKKNS